MLVVDVVPELGSGEEADAEAGADELGFYVFHNFIIKSKLPTHKNAYNIFSKLDIS